MRPPICSFGKVKSAIALPVIEMSAFGRMRSDTAIVHCKDCVHPIEAVERRAAGAGHAFIARFGSVIEIGTSRALQKIARRRRLVAQLGRSAGQQRARQHRVALPNAGIGRQIRIANLALQQALSD